MKGAGYLARVSFLCCAENGRAREKAWTPPITWWASCAGGHRKVSCMSITTHFLWRSFPKFCKVSWSINYMVVGIIVRITHSKINLIYGNGVKSL